MQEPNVASGAGSKQTSFQTGDEEPGNQPADQDTQALWMYELQMQLNAAAAGCCARDAADDMATAESPVAACQQALMCNFQQQMSRPTACADDQLADHLLQQLLQDMQLGPALTQEQQLLQDMQLDPALTQEQQQQQQQPLLDHHHQQQQQLLQAMMPQQLLQPPASPHVHFQLEQQQLLLSSCHEPQQLQFVQHHLEQQQQQLPDRSVFPAGTVADSCPLPVAEQLDHTATPGFMAYSSDVLHTWQAADQPGPAGYMLGKRNKQQLFHSEVPGEHLVWQPH
jgi:hypothetical protein